MLYTSVTIITIIMIKVVMGYSYFEAFDRGTGVIIIPPKNIIAYKLQVWEW